VPAAHTSFPTPAPDPAAEPALPAASGELAALVRGWREVDPEPNQAERWMPAHAGGPPATTAPAATVPGNSGPATTVPAHGGPATTTPTSIAPADAWPEPDPRGTRSLSGDAPLADLRGFSDMLARVLESELQRYGIEAGEE
jgi:hypothetical protein